MADGNFRGSYVDLPVKKRESIVVKIRTARSSTHGTRDFLSTVLLLIMQTLFVTLMIGLSLAVPISKIIIGAVKFHHCPAEPLLTLYLVVSGSISTVVDLLIILIRLLVTTKEDYYDNYNKLSSFFCFSTLVNTGLLVFGCVVVFPLLLQFTTDPADHKYCLPFLFWFTFWILLLQLLLYSVGLVSCVCLTCMLCVAPREPTTTIEITSHKNISPGGPEITELLVDKIQPLPTIPE